MVLKRIAGLFFALSFIMAIVLFTSFGRAYISFGTARIIFIIAGALALFFNLLSYTQGKHSAIFSFIYWLGSMVLFIGLVFKIMHWPFSYPLLIIGFGVLITSFFIPSKNKEQENEKNEDLLDDF